MPETKGKTITEITRLFKQQSASDGGPSDFYEPSVVKYDVLVDDPESDNNGTSRRV